ncbi:hypothetical protein ACQKWADRAFT_320150 [Trichoderma austrokoningii]
MFGFKPEEEGIDPKDKYFIKILTVYERINEALSGNVNYPPEGFTALHEKPLWMCGDTSWKWFAKEMNDPSIAPTRPLYLSRPDMFTRALGAWYYEQRFIINGDSGSVGICEPDYYAVTQVHIDVITFCNFFSNEISKTKSPVEAKEDVVETNTHLDDFQKSGSRIMFHEFVHRFGAEIEDEQQNRYRFVTTSKEKPGIKYELVKTYGYLWCSRLARTLPGGKYSGPEMATDTAETYTYFAMMAYLDNFDWSGDGKAKKIDGL